MRKFEDKHFQTEEELIAKSPDWSLLSSLAERQRPVWRRRREREGTVGKLGQAGGQGPEHSPRCQFCVLKMI